MGDGFYQGQAPLGQGGLGATCRRERKGASFSEEKEAKRLLLVLSRTNRQTCAK
jgi:hypothetical protein